MWRAIKTFNIGQTTFKINLIPKGRAAPSITPACSTIASTLRICPRTISSLRAHWTTVCTSSRTERTLKAPRPTLPSSCTLQRMTTLSSPCSTSWCKRRTSSAANPPAASRWPRSRRHSRCPRRAWPTRTRIQRTRPLKSSLWWALRKASKTQIQIIIQLKTKIRNVMKHQRGGRKAQWITAMWPALTRKSRFSEPTMPPTRVILWPIRSAGRNPKT